MDKKKCHVCEGTGFLPAEPEFESNVYEGPDSVLRWFQDIYAFSESQEFMTYYNQFHRKKDSDVSLCEGGDYQVLTASRNTTLCEWVLPVTEIQAGRAPQILMDYLKDWDSRQKLLTHIAYQNLPTELESLL